jgi:hypothetical protein
MDKQERDLIRSRIRKFDELQHKINRIERVLELWNDIDMIKIGDVVTYIEGPGQHTALNEEDDDCFVDDVRGFIEANLKTYLKGYKELQENV